MIRNDANMTRKPRNIAENSTQEASGTRVRAKKDLGQHFLVSSPVLNRIAETCRFASPGATGVLEIGPGTGALTSRLLELGRPLWAIEADQTLARSVGERLPSARVICADARTINLERLSAESGVASWMVVGNLPYNAGTDILKRVLRCRRRVLTIVVMLQREVARKFCAGAGEEGYGLLAAWTSVWWDCTLEFLVKPGAFRPQPKVTSAVCVFHPRPSPSLPDECMDGFHAFLSKAFAHPRKTLKRNLGEALGEGDSLLRPSDLSSEDYVRLFLKVADKAP